jgi:hypothetical protein
MDDRSRRTGDTTVQTTTTTARTTLIHDTIRRRMSDLARRSQALHVDARSINGIRAHLQA